MNPAPSSTPVLRRLRGTRGLSAISSVIVIAVVLALIGTVAYGIMGGFSSPGRTTCAPITAPACGNFANFHDVSLLVPFQSVQQGGQVPFTVTLPQGETATSYSYNWGDGSPVNLSSSPTQTHVFDTPGVYLVGVQATIAGVKHDNYQGLVQIKVNPSFTSITNQNLPAVAGSVISNSSTSASSTGPASTAVLQAGESVTLGASYTSSPTNPLWREVPPSISAPSGAKTVSVANGSVNASATLQFPTAGTYLVKFVGGSTNASSPTGTPPSVFENFTWTVFVASNGLHAGVVGLSSPRSPHPGTVISYEDAPGGARTEDPAIAYDTVSYEPILNVYQPLITYNGSTVGPLPQDFLPALATCVPGSSECAALYGADHTLVSGPNGTDYTFVINGAARFYDPITHASWGVYPSDVVFSIARTLGFSTLPCVSCNNGWILAQALLGGGNATWDTIHQSYNNTPQNILASMSVNDSNCPTQALQNDHGCVTFHANAHNRPWPYFLELIADPLGGGIVSCGWYSAKAQGAGIPFWTSGNSSGAGDHPCAMPGQGYGLSPSQIPYMGWDQWETLGSGSTGRFIGNVQYNMVGSGPYYLSGYSVSLSYTLTASPAYVQNPYCTWAACFPKPGSFPKTIEVTWEPEATQGEQALAAGVADFASIPSTDLSLLLQLIAQQKVNAITNPTLNLGFDAFDLNYNVEGAQRYSTEPVTIKNDFFSYLGMRQFFARAYPYTTIQDTINTKDGIVLGFNYGGAIPQYMGNYYPTNIAWPSSDPCTDTSNIACAGYWWNAMHDPTSIYYDREVSLCSASNPCAFPLFGQTGNPTGDIVNALYAKSVSQLSGGAITMNPIDINFANLIINSQSSSAGQNPMPMYGLGWAPDYPDPTDYITPLYLENSTYTYGDAFAQSLYTAQFSQGCPNPASDYNYYANLTQPVTQSCQGVAYKSMIKLLGIASVAPAGPYRVLLYDLAEKIANQLALYVYTVQSNGLGFAAAWVNVASLNTNPTEGAGGDTPFYWLTGNGLAG